MSEEIDTHLIDNEVPKDKARVIKDITAGTIGGIGQVLTGQPFDTVKVRLQSSNEYKGPMDVVKRLLANEGPAGFYKGVLTPLVGIGACVSIQFAVNEYMKRYYTNKNEGSANKSLTLGQFYMCGIAAGFANAFLTSPIEHIRIRLQTQVSAEGALYKGPVDCIRKIYSASGTAGIFRGLGPTLVRESHGMGIYFATYEFLINESMKTNKVKRTDIPGWQLCAFGGISGITLWMSIYPIDIIKTRLQTDDLKNKAFKNSFQCAKHILQTSGYKAFFNGFSVCLLRAFPANAMTFYAFELAMRALG
ncbi:organic acid transporter [Saccharomycopsis crataegensis]|uniref:Organic acid transporter n=1 Tax=Saccharomycopsis crataegensis TaxID=43959 RepID=A0AAV5QJT1_9ASCO|nr:organic acid transporter [Saccharomycopsis crataegensis]